MNREEIRKLIGGYATGTLTAAERRLLFEAAVDDQELFDELAGEQSLKELLEAPGVRTRLAASLESSDPPVSSRWWRRPWAWAGAVGLASAALVLVFMLRAPEPVQIAEVKQTPIPEPIRAAAPETEPVKAPASVPSATQEAPKAKLSAGRDNVAPVDEVDRRSAGGEKKEQAAAPAAAAPPTPPAPATFAAPTPAPEPTVQQVPPPSREQQQTQAFGGVAGQIQASQSQNAQQQTALTQQSQRAAGQVTLADQGAEQRKDQVRQQQDAVAALETTAKKAAPPPAKAVARFASADAAGSAFTYAVTGSTVRVTSPANGFFQVASRSTAQTITSAARRANRGEAIDFPLPSGARSIVITFAANEAALNSQGPAGQTVVDSRRERSGSVPLPANAEKVSVEISVQ